MDLFKTRCAPISHCASRDKQLKRSASYYIRIKWNWFSFVYFNVHSYSAQPNTYGQRAQDLLPLNIKWNECKCTSLSIQFFESEINSLNPIQWYDHQFCISIVSNSIWKKIKFMMNTWWVNHYSEIEISAKLNISFYYIYVC